MSILLEFSVYAMTAVFLENVLFSRALGAAQMLHALRRGHDLIPFGLLLTVMSTLSCALAYPLDLWLKEHDLQTLWRPFAFVLVASVLYVAVWLGLRYGLPKLHASIGKLLATATLNSVVLGAIFLTNDQNFSYAKALGFGLGSGLGFLVGSLLVREGRRRLALSNLPHAFRGFPSLVLYMGMLALALYGLVGHQLPF